MKNEEGKGEGRVEERSLREQVNHVIAPHLISPTFDLPTVLFHDT